MTVKRDVITKYPRHVVHGVGHVGCMHMCPCVSHLRVVADPNACNSVYWLWPVGFKPYLNKEWGGPSP